MTYTPPPREPREPVYVERRSPLGTVVLVLVVALLAVAFFYFVWPRIMPGSNTAGTTEPAVTTEALPEAGG